MRDKIKWGTPVKTTQKTIDKTIFPRHRRGLCLGKRQDYYLVVVCEGQVTPRIYHPSFWKKA